MHLVKGAVPAAARTELPIDPPAPEAIRMQLERLRTRAFAGSDKLFAFLRFVVEEALEGRGATLKELVIGIELYGGVVDYDPRIDSTVRVEARRLRRKLEAYYAGPGRLDPVIVSIPTGSYAPCFQLRHGGDGAPADPPRGIRPAMLAVLPFTALCPEERAFAAGVTDEIIHAAERAAPGCVTPRAIMFQFRETGFSLDDVAARAGADLLLHGTVRREEEVRRVSVEISNRFGQILWTARIDIAAEAGFDAQEGLAADILGRIPLDALRALPPIDPC